MYEFLREQLNSNFFLSFWTFVTFLAIHRGNRASILLSLRQERIIFFEKTLDFIVNITNDCHHIAQGECVNLNDILYRPQRLDREASTLLNKKDYERFYQTITKPMEDLLKTANDMRIKRSRPSVQSFIDAYETHLPQYHETVFETDSDQDQERFECIEDLRQKYTSTEGIQHPCKVLWRNFWLAKNPFKRWMSNHDPL